MNDRASGLGHDGLELLNAHRAELTRFAELLEEQQAAPLPETHRLSLLLDETDDLAASLGDRQVLLNEPSGLLRPRVRTEEDGSERLRTDLTAEWGRLRCGIARFIRGLTPRQVAVATQLDEPRGEDLPSQPTAGGEYRTTLRDVG